MVEPPPAPRPEAVAQKRGMIRRTAVFGLVAAFGLTASFFLEWIRVEPGWAERVDAAWERSVQERSRPLPAREDWERLGKLLGQGSLTGLEVFYWSRIVGWAGVSTERSPDAELNGRAIRVLSILLACIPVGSALVGVYFFVHRGRRARSPVLILCILLGATAVGLSGAYEIVQGPIAQVTDPAWGLGALRAFGAALALVGVFGVKARNWWRVYGGAALTGVAVAVISWQYVTTGSVP